MSNHAFAVADARLVNPIVVACHAAGKPPAAVAYDGANLTLTFSPDLVAAEVVTVTAVVRAAVSILTRVERDAIETFLATERTFVGLAQADFIALTQAQRDRMLFDVVTALIRVQRAMLRDG
jgi:hypothetical protein